MNSTPVWIFCIGLFLFGWRRILSYLRYFQQEEYSARRLWSWIKEMGAFDTRGSATVIATASLLWAIPNSIAQSAVCAIAAIILVWIAWRYEEDPRTTGKIRLNMTQRATKIAQGARLLLGVCALAPALMSCSSCYQAGLPPLKFAFLGVLVAQAPPLLLILANALLWPAEKALQDRFIADAKRILKEVDPFVIGITGSYGKTGAKAALGEILTQTLGATFWPRKSINTVLGITRTIREQMRPFHKYAVIEMGAYNIGSIKRLCDFTPPKASLVTAVGIMHLERFGSPENVYVAKSEIAQALPVEGILVCNGDSPNARRMAREHPRKITLLYGLDPSAGPLDCFASDISFSEQGTRFLIHWKGNTYPARTPLLGRPALLNILGAFTMACALGADPVYATATLANLEPVDNRLVLEKNRGASYLRDAYNSNPTGFAAALEVLRDLPAGRRILMTPGMIELGDPQSECNKQVASMAATICDVIIVVGKVNREALLAGLTAAQYPSEKLIVVDTRDEAFKVIKSRGASGDLVLIENDLGDLHEGRIAF